MGDSKKAEVVDSLAFKTPNGRTVYGGGGIAPDFDISYPNDELEQWNSFFLNSNLMNNFVFEEMDKNRTRFNSLKEEDLLLDKFESMLPWQERFEAYCEEKEIELEIKEQDVLKAVKAYLGLQLFGENTFNQIKNEEDLFMEKALQTLDRLAL